MSAGAVLSPPLPRSGYLRSMAIPIDGLATGILMLAFYAFGEWAHRRQLAQRRAKVVPFPRVLAPDRP